MRIILRTAIHGICLLVPAQTAFAGAWLQGKGEGLIISGSEYNQASLAFDASGALETPVDFSKIDSSLYVEYGLSRALTLVGSTALQDVSYTSSEGPQSFNGFATSKIGVRAGRKFGDNWALSVQPSLVIPAGGEAIPDGDLGLGGYGAELRLAAGRGFSWRDKPGFFGAEAAYDYRSGGAPRQITTDVTLGISPSRDIQLLGQAFYRHTNESLVQSDSVLSNESLKLQASVVFKVPRLFSGKGDEAQRGGAAQKNGETQVEAETQAAQNITSKSNPTYLQFGYFQTLAGRNIVREQGVIVKLWNRF